MVRSGQAKAGRREDKVVRARRRSRAHSISHERKGNRSRDREGAGATQNTRHTLFGALPAQGRSAVAHRQTKHADAHLYKFRRKGGREGGVLFFHTQERRRKLIPREAFSKDLPLKKRAAPSYSPKRRHCGPNKKVWGSVACLRDITFLPSPKQTLFSTESESLMPCTAEMRTQTNKLSFSSLSPSFPPQNTRGRAHCGQEEAHGVTMLVVALIEANTHRSKEKKAGCC